jgi:hypothetical protein
MKPLIAASALALGAFVFAGTADAQSSDWLDGGRSAYSPEVRQSYYDSRRAAYDTGFREGVKEGEKDGRKGDVFEFHDEKAYQHADKGFHREYGSLERYRQSFRTGFSAGYAEAYERFAPRYGSSGRILNDRRGTPGWSRGPSGVFNPNTRPGVGYPGSAGYYSPAYDNGANDGYEKGLEDARKHRSFDPLRHDWYRSGDRHYESRYGSKEQYKDLYREAFRSGYERGYRERTW